MPKKYDPANFRPNAPATYPEADDASTYKTSFNIRTGQVEIEANGLEDHNLAMAALERGALKIGEYLSDPLEDERAARKESLAAAEQEILRQHLAAVLPPPPVVKVSPSLIKVREAYEKSRSDLSASTLRDYLRAIDWFVDFVGPEKPIEEVTVEDAEAWKAAVKSHYLAIREKKQAERLKKGHIKPDPIAGLPEPEASIDSVDNNIMRVQAFMAFAQEKRHFSRDLDLPTDNLTMVSHAARKKLDAGYQPFTADELKKIFSPENFLAQKKPHDFWVPLIALFSGARVGEISQIYKNDLTQDENKVWTLSINDKELKRVKTSASNRVIPIHPVLIELGLIDYLNDVKTAVPESDRLFPYLRYDEQNGFGDVPGETFARYLDKLGIHDESKVFHSFRFTANQRMKTRGVEVSIRSQLVGHEREGVNEISYANDLTIPELQTLLATNLVYPELTDCFPKLVYPKGRFSEVLRKEMDLAITRKRKIDPKQNEKLKNHLEAKAQREARAATKKPVGRPPKIKTVGK